MTAHTCPFHSTWLQFVDHQVFNGRCYRIVERSLQGSNLGSTTHWLCDLEEIAASLCLTVSSSSKTEVAVVLTTNETSTWWVESLAMAPSEALLVASSVLALLLCGVAGLFVFIFK